MADIVCSTTCTNWVDGHAVPTSCNSVDFGFPKIVILAAPDTTFAWGSDNLCPTAAEFTTAGSDIFILNDIANGVKMPTEPQVITGADTPDNLPDVISEMTGISGNIVRFNLDILNDLETLNCYNRLKMWFITNKGWCFGGNDGFTISNHVGDWIHEGFNNRSKIPFEFKWFKTPATTTPARQEDAYLDLTN